MRIAFAAACPDAVLFRDIASPCEPPRHDMGGQAPQTDQPCVSTPSEPKSKAQIALKTAPREPVTAASTTANPPNAVVSLNKTG